jgi:TPR repeat protein
MKRMERVVIEEGGATAHACAPEALFELGMIYCVGRDVSQDLVNAHKWFNLAAMRGNSQALGYRREISREMTDLQIAAAQKTAREWLAAY